MQSATYWGGGGTKLAVPGRVPRHARIQLPARPPPIAPRTSAVSTVAVIIQSSNPDWSTRIGAA